MFGAECCVVFRVVFSNRLRHAARNTCVRAVCTGLAGEVLTLGLVALGLLGDDLAGFTLCSFGFLVGEFRWSWQHAVRVHTLYADHQSWRLKLSSTQPHDHGRESDWLEEGSRNMPSLVFQGEMCAESRGKKKVTYLTPRLWHRSAEHSAPASALTHSAA